MTVKPTTTTDWSKRAALKSAMLFLLHGVIFLMITALLLWHDKFDKFGDHLQEQGANYLYALFCIILLFTIAYFYFYFEDKSFLMSGKNITLVFTIIDLYVIMSFFLGEKIDIYARPVAFVALMISILLSRSQAVFLNVLSALLMFVIDTFAGMHEGQVTQYYSSLIISFSAGMMAIFFCDRAKTRFRIVGIGILIVVPIDLIVFFLELALLLNANEELVLEIPAFEGIFRSMGYGLFGGVMSTVFFLVLLPVFESIFNRLTVFRIRELTSSDAKILQKLKEEAPGTYNHSVMVAQLAEASAAAIGENVDYARAAALYHDVGKLHCPEHFTENQKGYNLHDELAPELSADIIRSHAQEGRMLIRNHHLPEFLADVAVQHHGTLPIRYFYAKALKMTDAELNIDDFSYLGPKPQTKIAAIIMIADASEAAVRATNSRDPQEADKAIGSVIEERMNLEQFSDCDITMSDLTKIRLALVNTLTGVYHQRIKYPKLVYKRNNGKTKGENV